MIGFLGAASLWVKAAHVIFVIFWMAGMLMLPRYLIHNQQALGDPAQEALWTVRHSKLPRLTVTPPTLMFWLPADSSAERRVANERFSRCVHRSRPFHYNTTPH